MKYLISAILAFACLLVGCDENVQNGDVVPFKIELSMGDIDATSVEFSVMAQGATKCAYMYVVDDVVLEATQILDGGVAIEVDSNGYAHCKVLDLEPGTEYNLYVAASNGESTAVAHLSMTTLDVNGEQRLPSVGITPGQTSVSSISFTITPVNADRCSYLLFEEGEQPTIEDIFANGVEVSADSSSDIVVEELYSGSDYYVVAAVSSGDDAYKCAPVVLSTLDGDVEYVTLMVDNAGGSEWYGTNNYFMVLTDSANQKWVELDIYFASDANPIIPAGTYSLDVTNTSTDNAIGEQYSRYAEIVDGVERGVKFETATLTIEHRDDNYVVEFEAKLYDEDRVVVAEYVGVPPACSL